MDTNSSCRKKKDIAIYTSVSLAISHVPSGKFVWYETAIFDLDRKMENHLYEDIFMSGAIIHAVLNDEYNPYHTKLPGSMLSSTKVWNGYRLLNVSISAVEFVRGLQDVNNAFYLDLVEDHTDWTIVNLNVEVE